MKIRQGFVGNSSSSSFLIYGIYLEVTSLIDNGERSQDITNKGYKLALKFLEKKNKESEYFDKHNVSMYEIRKKVQQIHGNKFNQLDLYMIIKDGKREDGVPDEIYEIALDYQKHNEFEPSQSIDYYEFFKALDEEFKVNQPWDGVYIGKSWSKIKDNQTGLDFKKEIESKLKPYFKNVEFDTYEAAWRD